VSTTILNPDGTRNIGSELPGPARRAIDAGKSFVGISPVGDRSFISRYDFLRDANGNDIGVLASELPLVLRDVAAARIMRAVFTSTLIALIVCAVTRFWPESGSCSKRCAGTTVPIAYAATASCLFCRKPRARARESRWSGCGRRRLGRPSARR
jgi:Cache 3/Cache 2 fusion domain